MSRDLKPLLQLLFLIPVGCGVLASVGYVASIVLGISLGLSFLFVALSSIAVGALLLFGGKNNPKETYRRANVVSGEGYVTVFPEVQPAGADQNQKLYTPSGMASQTRIRGGGRSWLTVSQAGATAIVSGLVVVAIVALLSLA